MDFDGFYLETQNPNSIVFLDLNPLSLFNVEIKNIPEDLAEKLYGYDEECDDEYNLYFN